MTTGAVREIVVNASEEALNAAITEHQIQPEKIISVIFQPQRTLAVGTMRRRTASFIGCEHTRIERPGHFAPAVFYCAASLSSARRLSGCGIAMTL